jgi:hypothetical protein
MTRLREDLSPPERRDTARRLWAIYDMIEGGRSRGDIQDAIRYAALEIQPFCALYEEGDATNPCGPAMEASDIPCGAPTEEDFMRLREEVLAMEPRDD